MNADKPIKILFLVPYPVKRAPSQRFRVELFIPYLNENNIRYTIAPFMSEATWNVLYNKGSILQKSWGIIKGYLSRIKSVLIDVHGYDYVFVHREAAPLGPPVFEWIISKLWRKKMIYDFDDAIWIPNTGNENKLVALLKANWKVKKICSWAHKVAGGNNYLCDFARQYNKNVILLPTCVDMERMHKGHKEHKTGTVTIGWTGSHSTLSYLDPLVDVLAALEKEYNTHFLVIANRDPKLNLKNYEFIPWNEAREIQDLLKIDIGIMPLLPDKWSEGKCGFKLIQYLSLGIPAVASPVGVNKTIIEEGNNGYLCNTPEQWKSKLKVLIEDTQLRKQMGANGQQKIAAEYSVQVQHNNFLNLFS